MKTERVNEEDKMKEEMKEEILNKMNITPNKKINKAIKKPNLQPKLSFFILFTIFILTLLQLLVFATPELKELGESCKFSAECREGYCGDGICRYPAVLEDYDTAGECNATVDCLSGFCGGGICIIPKREEYTILSFGAKSGCAGIIENCMGIWCLFCNVTWILLIVGAAVAAFIATRRKGRLLPVFAFILPVAMGLIVFPIAGFLLTIIEIFLISLIKTKTKKIRR